MRALSDDWVFCFIVHNLAEIHISAEGLDIQCF